MIFHVLISSVDSLNKTKKKITNLNKLNFWFRDQIVLHVEYEYRDQQKISNKCKAKWCKPWASQL